MVSQLSPRPWFIRFIRFPLNFEILPSTSSWLLGSNPPPWPGGELGDQAGGGLSLGMMSTHSNTHKGGLELRACNSQPSEPFMYWGLKIYRSTFNDISLCKIKMQPQNKGPGMLWGRAMSCPWHGGWKHWGPPFSRHATLRLFHLLKLLILDSRWEHDIMSVYFRPFRIFNQSSKSLHHSNIFRITCIVMILCC